MKKKYKNYHRRYECPPETTVAKLKRLQRETDRKFVDLRLNADQLDAIRKCHSLVPFPWYYSVKTKYFSNIKYIKSRILKDLHYAYVKGKKSLTLNMTHYTSKDLKDLSNCGIKYSVCKYRVFLR